MRIQIEQSELMKYVNIVQKGISSKTTLPILDGILIETIDNRIKITGTDLEFPLLFTPVNKESTLNEVLL